MYCKNCGNEVSEKAVMCVACGTPPKAGNKFCYNCKAETATNAVICVKCGVSLQSKEFDIQNILSSDAIKQPSFWAAVVILIAFFLPWVSGSFGLLNFTISGWGLRDIFRTIKSMSDEDITIPAWINAIYFIPVLSILLIISFLTDKKYFKERIRTWKILTGTYPIGFFIILIANMKIAGEKGATDWIGFGLYLSLASGAYLIYDGIFKTKKTSFIQMYTPEGDKNIDYKANQPQQTNLPKFDFQEWFAKYKKIVIVAASIMIICTAAYFILLKFIFNTIEKKTWYDSNNTKLDEMFYVSKEPPYVKEGSYKKYSEDGKLLREYSYSKGEFDGLCINYYETGELKEKINYSDGKLDGVYELYQSNGNKSALIHYKNGLKDGVQENYFDDGKLQMESFYTNDSLNGDYKEYFPTGQLSNTATFTNGKSNGVEIYYFESGKIKRKVPAKMGLIDGAVEDYFENGSIQETVHFSKGIKSGEAVYFNSQHTYKSIVEFANDNIQGCGKSYYCIGENCKELTGICGGDGWVAVKRFPVVNSTNIDINLTGSRAGFLSGFVSTENAAMQAEITFNRLFSEAAIDSFKAGVRCHISGNWNNFKTGFKLNDGTTFYPGYTFTVDKTDNNACLFIYTNEDSKTLIDYFINNNITALIINRTEESPSGRIEGKEYSFNIIQETIEKINELTQTIIK